MQMPSSSILPPITVAAGPRFWAEAAALLLLAAAIGCAALLWPEPSTRLATAARDLARFLILAIAAFQGVRLLLAVGVRAAPAALLALLAVMALGTSVELLEWQAGEAFSRVDVAMDLAASLCGLAANSLRAAGAGRGRFTWLGVALSLVAGAVVPFALVAGSYAQRRASFPVLLDAGHHDDLDWIRPMPHPVRIEHFGALQSGAPAEPAFVVPLDAGPMPGLALDEPYSDWRGYHALVLDLFNPGDTPLDLILNVDDMRGSGEPGDRYDEAVHLPPRSGKVLRTSFDSISKALPHRRFAFEDMDIVMIYRPEPAAGERLLVRRMWLE